MASLHDQERVVYAVTAEDRLDRRWPTVEQRGRLCELHEHREQRAAVDQQRDLRPPEQGRSEPVAERGGRRVAVDDGRALHSIAQLLGTSDHEHGVILAPAGVVLAGRDFYRNFYRTGEKRGRSEPHRLAGHIVNVLVRGHLADERAFDNTPRMRVQVPPRPPTEVSAQVRVGVASLRRPI